LWSACAINLQSIEPLSSNNDKGIREYIDILS
jgi:hypothetical protein